MQNCVDFYYYRNENTVKKNNTRDSPRFFYAALHFQVIFAREEKKGKTQVNIKAFDPNKSHGLLKPWRSSFYLPIPPNREVAHLAGKCSSLYAQMGSPHLSLVWEKSNISIKAENCIAAIVKLIKCWMQFKRIDYLEAKIKFITKNLNKRKRKIIEIFLI